MQRSEGSLQRSPRTHAEVEDDPFHSFGSNHTNHTIKDMKDGIMPAMMTETVSYSVYVR